LLIDTHAHLNCAEFKFIAKEVVNALKRDNIEAIVVPSFDLASSQRAVELSGEFEPVFAAVGIHPNDSSQFGLEETGFIESVVGNPKVVAIGEIGLDYYRNTAPVNTQKHVFIKQLEMAKKAGLPTIFHVRDAFDDFFKIVSEYSYLITKGVVHCFSGGVAEAKQALELGLMVSFTGNITYKNNDSLLEALKFIPLERIMTETDCPYMAPLPDRGHTCYPRHVNLVAQRIAEVKGISLAEVERVTVENTLKFFFKMEGRL